MTITEVRKAAGLTQAALSKLLGIPKRTIEDWDRGARTPPDYVVALVAYRLGIELEK